MYQSGGPEGWGQRSIEHILTALGYMGSGGYSDAVRQFQADVDLSPVDGIAGPNTRGKLFAKYMDYLCPRIWAKTDFLGRGGDAGGKGDYQGCGEYNPYVVFSQTEEPSFLQPENQATRNADNAINRRVVVYLFRPGTVATPEKWPCPRATEGRAGA